MSGFVYPPSLFDSGIYNPNNYLSQDQTGSLSYAYAQTLYLSKNDYRLSYLTGVSVGQATIGLALVPDDNLDISGLGTISCSELLIGGEPITLNLPSYLTGITEGVGSPGKALVLNSSANIVSGVASMTLSGTLSAASLVGTLSTSSQPNITSLGTLSSLTIGGNLTFTGSSRSLTGLTTLSLSGTLTSGTINATTFQQSGVTYNLASFLTSIPTSLSVSSISTSSLIQNGVSYNLASFLTSIPSSLSVSSINANTFQQAGVTYNLSSFLTSVPSSISLSSISTSSLIQNGVSYNLASFLTSVPSSISLSSISTSSLIQNGVSYNLANFLTSVPSSISVSTISSGTIYGNLQTASQTAITEIGTLGSLNVSNSINCSSLTVNGVSITTNGGATSKVFSVTAGTNHGAGSRHGEYNLCIDNDKDTIGSSAGISFAIDTASDASSGLAMTPSAVILARRTGGSFALSDLSFLTRSADSVTSLLTERLRLHQDGRISFGNVVGAQDWNFLRGSSCGLRIGSQELLKDCMTLQWNQFSSGNNSNYLSFDPYGSSNALVIKASGWVGIGLPDPESQFHAGSSVWCNQWFHTKANGVSAALSWRGSSYSSYVGIGSYSSTTQSIRFAAYDSNFSFTAYVPVYGGSYTNASDERLKKDIEDIPYGLDTIMALKPRRFKWKQDERVSIGFIAQEVQPIVPEPVSTPEGDLNELNSEGLPINTMGVDYASLTAILCKAIQDLNGIVSIQQVNIEQQRIELIGLLNRISLLENSNP